MPRHCQRLPGLLQLHLLHRVLLRVLLFGRCVRELLHESDELWLMRPCLLGKHSHLLRRRVHQPLIGPVQLRHVRTRLQRVGSADLPERRLHEPATAVLYVS